LDQRREDKKDEIIAILEAAERAALTDAEKELVRRKLNGFVDALPREQEPPRDDEGGDNND
jgi:hypothetical protein